MKISTIYIVFFCAMIFGACSTNKNTKMSVESESISIVYKERTIEGVYTGELVDNVPNGEGTFEENNFHTFKYGGHWENGKLEGNGTLYCEYYEIKFPGESKNVVGTFEGTVQDGNAVEGRFIAQDDQGSIYVYNGEFEELSFGGNGKVVYESGTVHDGLFEEGEFVEIPSQKINDYLEKISRSAYSKITCFHGGISSKTLSFIDEWANYFGAYTIWSKEHESRDTVKMNKSGLSNDFDFNKCLKNNDYNTKICRVNGSNEVLEYDDGAEFSITNCEPINSIIVRNIERPNEVYMCLHFGWYPNMHHIKNVSICGLPVAHVKYYDGSDEVDCIVMLEQSVNVEKRDYD